MVPFDEIKMLFPDHITFTAEYWAALDVNSKFAHLGDAFGATYCSRTSIHFTQQFGYTFAKFIFATVGKLPSEGTCRLVSNLLDCQTVPFSFTSESMKIWNDINLLPLPVKYDILEDMCVNTNDCSKIFQIILKRLRTYGLSTLSTICECVKKFPTIPWEGIFESWYPGEFEKAGQAMGAFKNVMFPILEKELLDIHSVAHYRQVGGACAHILEFTGANKTIGRHVGLKSYRLTDEKKDYILKMMKSEKPEGVPVRESTWRIISEFTQDGMSDDDLRRLATEHREKVAATMSRINAEERNELIRQARLHGFFAPDAGTE
ncbi:hypothetical protein BLA29_006509 [Euroglyphus maynei]|uniref:Uncharacterized protein n=1 Tax=Euroglyphus maynei TaxID=6958 RepID=A0A1Y3BGF7_EURMA|nr:hypothetical protein BLA29_006509 [Euroglyphus maynei]